ncbi:hypothetical protein RUM43_012578 [Polyplax serrata]|uniref:Uncharacterized protein n=1 Tax=Polyplax serrata TaxID=468196 RepID=A0AAN8PSA7_POLSC
MSSEVKIREPIFMDNTSETESLRLRIREVEDENQELRTQNLLQNRTIIEMRNEIVLLRLQMSEMADTSALLTERVRNLTQSIGQNTVRGETDGNGLITTPPLMAPPPVPPPLPPARIRISPRQVGAGEALTTLLGVSLSSPPRHRIKRDTRQGFYRSTRSPYRRLGVLEPGPSTATQYLCSERPNYFVGLRIIPQFQTYFVCSQNHPVSSGCSDSASDSSGSDENPQLFKKIKMKVFDGDTNAKKSPAFARDFELMKNVRNFHHQRVRQTILQNYNLSMPNTNSKFFFPLSWERKNRDNPTLPSTSGNIPRFFQSSNADMGSDHSTQGPSTMPMRNPNKISNSTQYTFPTIHEGLHHNGGQSAVTQTGETARLRKLKKNIPYSSSSFSGAKSSLVGCKADLETEEDIQTFLKRQRNLEQGSAYVDSESVSSVDEAGRSQMSRTGELLSDLEQDGFQADESSNCMTSTENSLEKISISEFNLKKKEDDGKS